jgi:hypothetical protein
VDPEFERGHHPEVATAAAEGPEQVVVLFLVGHQELAVGGHDAATTSLAFAHRTTAAGRRSIMAL